MASPIVTATAASTELRPAPIASSWILSGRPDARNKQMALSDDRTSYVMVWDCAPGEFNWHYTEDETVVIVSGEVFITDDKGERRLGPGDFAFFPAGCSCKWRVTNHVRKVAVLRTALPYPLAFAARAWNKLLKVLGIRGEAPL